MSSGLHERQNSRLFDYLEGVLTAEERGDFERHLEGCEACREELRMVRRLDEVVAEIPEPKLPVKFFDDLRVALDEVDADPSINGRRLPAANVPTALHEGARGERRPRPGWYLLALGTALLLILGAAWALRLGG